jgi:hypothetical protein
VAIASSARHNLGMAEQAPKRRRWFQFSLTTMLVVITVIAVWLGWNLSRVRQREATIVFLKNSGMSVAYPTTAALQIPPWKHLPFGWRILGAKPVRTVYLPQQFKEVDREQVRGLFPEAAIVIIGDK